MRNRIAVFAMAQIGELFGELAQGHDFADCPQGWQGLIIFISQMLNKDLVASTDLSFQCGDIIGVFPLCFE